MYRKLILLVVLYGLQSPAYLHAQKEQLTMEQAVMGLYTDFAVPSLGGFEWIPETSQFSYYSSEEPQNLLIYDAADKKIAKKINLEEVKTDLKASALSLMHWVSESQFVFYNPGFVYSYDLGKSKLTEHIKIPQGAENLEIASDGSFATYTQEHSLYISTPASSEPIAIAESNTLDVVYGQTVSRSEYGIYKGIFISPKNHYIAYYQKDQTQVSDYPIIDWNDKIATSQNIKYPMAGTASETITLHVYDVKNNQSHKILADNSDNAYLTCVSWSPDEKNIYLQHLNRATTKTELQKFDAKSGKYLTTLHTQTSDKYVEPQHPITFINDQDFILQSDESGYNHLYLYTPKNKKLKQITSGKWQVNNYLGYNEADDALLFTGSKDDPREEHIYFQKLDKESCYRIDKQPGWHSPQLSPDGQYIIDYFSSASVPGQYELITTHTEDSHTLLANRNPLEKVQTSVITNVNIPTEDGTELYARILTAPDIDKTKEHPAIVYLYNGPHVQLIKNRFPASGNLWYDYLTSRGYVVFVMDGRGSSNRGRDFEQATYRQLGQVEMQDQIKGLQFLKMQTYVDPDRVGVHGWSFGGFMTTSLMLYYPDAFRVGVAGGPVMDWAKYEVMYTERYMDTPDENPEGYQKTQLLGKADKLKGKLLLIHGAEDDVVVWQHSMNFIQECIDKNIPIDYFVYPRAKHNVRGSNRVHLMQKITDYFDLHLKNEQ